MFLLLPETKGHLIAMSIHYHHNIVMTMILSQVFLFWLSNERAMAYPGRSKDSSIGQ